MRQVRCPAPWLSLAGPAVLLFSVATLVSAEPSKRVLVVNSFGSAAPPFTVHSVAFETALVNKMPGGVDLDEVSLDMARYADDGMQDAIAEYLEKRQINWKPDLVVPIGSPAGRFVFRYRERLFPTTPILYTSLDRRLLATDSLRKNAAYIGQIFDLPKLIEDMLMVAPATKNIAVVIGDSQLERYWLEAFEQASQSYRDRVNFIYFNKLPFDQMLDRAAHLPENSFIFFLLLLRDAAGVTHNADEALQQMHSVANAPINGIFEHELGLGIVGGRLYQGGRIGMEAAEMAVRILHGEPASNFAPRLIDPLPPRYDSRELKRWNLDSKPLPPGSEVLYRQPTIWEEHRRAIIFGVVLCLAQALLILGLLLNLFRRRRAETSLTESEARFLNAADAAPVLMWMSGPDKLCTFCNKLWLEFTGRKMQEEVGNGWTEGIHADDFENSVRGYETAFDARKPFTIQYRLRRKDGEYRFITDKGIPRYDNNGVFVGYVGACVDISDLLKQQEALHQIEERVTLAAEAAELGVWELDSAIAKLWISDKSQALFGFTSDEITYEDFAQRVHPEDRGATHALMLKAIETTGDYETEFRIVLPDGTVRWISGRARCAGNNEKWKRLIGVSMDVTKRKGAEEAARRQRDQIELLGRASLLGEMTASLAHELNQPLSAIVSNANAGMRFLDSGKGDRATIYEILQDVVADGCRANGIIQNVRNTIKKGTAARRLVNLNELVKEVAHIVQPNALAYSCDVQTALGDDLPAVEADPVQIQQVLVNLLNNAFEAMATTPPQDRQVAIVTERNGNDTVAVTVRDHGAGFNNGTADHLFEHFFTTKENGLGLGLSIVRSIVESHGGSISAQNAETGGARFHFTLPMSKGVST